MDNSGKTIKDLADEIGVSKDKVKYRVRKLPSELTTKKDGVTYLSNKAISIICDELVGKNTRVIPSENTQSLPSVFITNELEKRDKEIAEKNKQIDELHFLLKNQNKLLDQQQQLTLQANKKIEQLELNLEIIEEQQEKKSVNDELEPNINNAKDVEEIVPEKKGFWQKLFSK